MIALTDLWNYIYNYVFKLNHNTLKPHLSGTRSSGITVNPEGYHMKKIKSIFTRKIQFCPLARDVRVTGQPFWRP